MVAVGYFTAHLTGTFAEMDADKAGLSRGDAMFEGILYEGDENEWGYFRTAIGTDIDLGLYGHVGGKTDTHQLDIVADEVHFFAQGNKVLLVIVENMAQKTAQLLDSSLCFIAIKSDKGIDIVQGIEQEVRIQLITQVFQFSFCTAFLCLTTGSFHFYPVRTIENTSRRINIQLGGPGRLGGVDFT